MTVPSVSVGFGTCDLEAGCTNGCGGAGVCMPVRITHTASSSSSSSASSYSSYSSSLSSSSSLSTLPHSHHSYDNLQTIVSPSPSITRDSTLYCHCDTGSYGPLCRSPKPPMCVSSNHTMTLDLYDSLGDGWTFTNYAITNVRTGMIVDGAFDSMCAGKQDQRIYCVLPGRLYHVRDS